MRHLSSVQDPIPRRRTKTQYIQQKRNVEHNTKLYNE